MISKNNIRKRAEELLSHLQPGFPVDLGAIARTLNIKVTEIPLEDDVSGMIVMGNEDKAAIGINQAHAPVRKRFTFAHEIGHYVLHRQPGKHFIDKVRYRRSLDEMPLKPDPDEVEANYFAAELLMPRFEIERLIEESPSDFIQDEMVTEMAGHFGVSVQAMMVRLNSLGYIPDWGML